MWIIALLLLITFEAIADIFSKEYSVHGTLVYWCLAILGYITANIFWLSSIRNGSGLTRGAIIFSIGSAIVAILIGYVKYQEKIEGVQFVGIFFGIVALVLIFWPDLLIFFRG